MDNRKDNILKYAVAVLFAMGLALTAYVTKVIFTYAGAGMAACFAVVVILILIGIFFLQKKSRTASIVLAVISVVILALVSASGHKADNMLKKVEAKEEMMTVQIVVLKGSSLTAESDLSGCHLSYVNGENGAYKRAEEILKENKKTINLSIPHGSPAASYDSLVNGESQLMLLSETTKEVLDTERPGFRDNIRVLFEKQYPMGHINLKPVDISKEPFTLYLQGADLSSGDNINSVGRGDANILLTVNPETKKVNMQVIPRDTFVNIPSMGGRSKLSYSGVWGGIQSSIESIEETFDIEINYYAKINFQGVIDLVDALGGVEVYSMYNFNAGKYHFNEGYNCVDGDAALNFVRERKSLPENELSRGRNQMAMVKAIITKFGQAPDFDTALSILDTLSDNFVTNVPKSDYMKAFNLFVKVLPELKKMEPKSVKGEFRWHDDEVRTEQYKYYFYPADGEKERVKREIEAVLEGK